MLEEKIEDLKNNTTSESSTKQDVSIDLQISAGLPDTYFQSETDKIQFYREIESLRNIEELESMIQGFTDINENIPKASKNLFSLLRLKILARKYKIFSIKRLGVNYQIDFQEHIQLEELKRFLEQDKAVHFHVVDVKRVRSSTKVFENDEKFLQYILDMFEKRATNPKIQLKSKK